MLLLLAVFTTSACFIRWNRYQMAKRLDIAASRAVQLHSDAAFSTSEAQPVPLLTPCTLAHNVRTMQAVYHLRQLNANRCSQAQVREQLLGMVQVETVTPAYPKKPYRLMLPYVVTIRGETQGIPR